MSELRKRFEEKLSERVKIILIDCDFNDFENRYCYCDFEKKDDFNLGVINGAWYMFFEDHEKQQAIIDNLKAQLNNMETCYIEKKKRVDELEGALNEVKEWKSHPVEHEASLGSWGVRDFYRALAKKALRGAND